jgi:hypothetical protein
LPFLVVSTASVTLVDLGLFKGLSKLVRIDETEPAVEEAREPVLEASTSMVSLEGKTMLRGVGRVCRRAVVEVLVVSLLSRLEIDGALRGLALGS